MGDEAAARLFSEVQEPEAVTSTFVIPAKAGKYDRHKLDLFI